MTYNATLQHIRLCIVNTSQRAIPFNPRWSQFLMFTTVQTLYSMTIIIKACYYISCRTCYLYVYIDFVKFIGHIQRQIFNR